MNKEKFLKLTELALSGDSCISRSIKVTDLDRLVDGDLSEYGDAIIAGRRVCNTHSKCNRYLYFSADKNTYYIEKPKMYGIEYEELTEDDFVHEPFPAYGVCFTNDHDFAVLDFMLTQDNPLSKNINKTIFKNKKDAIAITKKMTELLNSGKHSYA